MSNKTFTNKFIIILLGVALSLSVSTLAQAKGKSNVFLADEYNPQAKPKVKSDAKVKVSTININKANEQQLAKMLKGVGLKKARAIVEYRKQFGAFKSISELSAVKGIGKQTIEKNKGIISL